MSHNRLPGDKLGPLRACLGGARDFALATRRQTPHRFLPCRHPRRFAAGVAAGKEAFLGSFLVHNHRSTDARSAGAEVLDLWCATSLPPNKMAMYYQGAGRPGCLTLMERTVERCPLRATLGRRGDDRHQKKSCIPFHSAAPGQRLSGPGRSASSPRQSRRQRVRHHRERRQCCARPAQPASR